MIERGVTQTVGFVKNINGIFGCREYRPAPQRQVGHHQVVVGDDTVCTFERFSRLEKTALCNKPAASTGTLVAIDR